MTAPQPSDEQPTTLLSPEDQPLSSARPRYQFKPDGERGLLVVLLVLLALMFGGSFGLVNDWNNERRPDPRALELQQNLIALDRAERVIAREHRHFSATPKSLLEHDPLLAGPLQKITLRTDRKRRQYNASATLPSGVKFSISGTVGNPSYGSCTPPGTRSCPNGNFLVGN